MVGIGGKGGGYFENTGGEVEEDAVACAPGLVGEAVGGEGVVED